MASWCLCCQSETTLDSKPLSYRTYSHGYMYFVKEFLCNDPLSFIVPLELDWLEWWLPGDHYSNLYCALNMLTMKHLALDSRSQILVDKVSMPHFITFFAQLGLLPCLTPTGTPLRDYLQLSWIKLPAPISRGWPYLVTLGPEIPSYLWSLHVPQFTQVHIHT